jgi:hypothetical protein
MQGMYAGQQMPAYGYGGGVGTTAPSAIAQAAQGLAPEQAAKLSQIVAQVSLLPSPGHYPASQHSFSVVTYVGVLHVMLGKILH